ncbi:response regulator [Myxococcota bacterium]|jgi:signal transduction histidine kinase|nr:response regulator [Myxococcota bacterium]
MAERPSRILVVDDEVGMRDGCRRILASEGYEVETAEDGQAALEKFRAAGGFDVVISDLRMPRMGGMDLIEALRALDEDALLLVITAYATIDTAVDATKRGAYGYIPKPFTPDELLLHVRNGLEKRALRIEAKALREERERRLLEVAFERSKSTTILHCMTDGVLVVNREGRIVLRNAALSRILPSCSDHPLPVPVAEAVELPELVSMVMEVVQAEAQVIASREIAIGPCTYMVNAAPVLEPSGETLGAVAVLRDITALKKLEIAKSMFVSMVAHELKSPLATIESSLDIVLSGIAGSDPDRDRQMLQRARLRASTLRTLVSDLLNLTAIQTGNFRLKRQHADLCAIVREAVDAQSDRAAEKRIELLLECGDPSAVDPILADTNAVRSVVSNLVDNAIKYTPEGGHVHVRVDSNGLYARVIVKDDGIGMSPAERDRIFDEFFRVKNDYTAHVPGTGLGLTLVRRLVDMHQGRIEVDSAPGKGSVFSVSFPTVSYATGM